MANFPCAEEGCTNKQRQGEGGLCTAHRARAEGKRVVRRARRPAARQPEDQPTAEGAGGLVPQLDTFQFGPGKPSPVLTTYQFLQLLSVHPGSRAKQFRRQYAVPNLLRLLGSDASLIDDIVAGRRAVTDFSRAVEAARARGELPRPSAVAQAAAGAERTLEPAKVTEDELAMMYLRGQLSGARFELSSAAATYMERLLGARGDVMGARAKVEVATLDHEAAVKRRDAAAAELQEQQIRRKIGRSSNEEQKRRQAAALDRWLQARPDAPWADLVRAGASAPAAPAGSQQPQVVIHNHPTATANPATSLHQAANAPQEHERVRPRPRAPAPAPKQLTIQDVINRSVNA
eukprot:tig00000492_g1540.t1